MVRITKIIAIFIVTIFIISCNKNRVYEEHKTNFPQFRWEKSNVVDFNPEITDTVSNYEVTVALRHIFGFNLESIKIDFEIISPSGEKSMNEYLLSFYDEENNLLSMCAGDFCDFEQIIEDDFNFKETGAYQIKIFHRMDVNPIPNIMEVGLIIEKHVPTSE